MGRTPSKNLRHSQLQLCWGPRGALLVACNTGAFSWRDVHGTHPPSNALLHVQRGIPLRHHVSTDATRLLFAARLRWEGNDGNYRLWGFQSIGPISNLTPPSNPWGRVHLETSSVGITVLLSFSVFLLRMGEDLPETSEFIPLLSKSDR